MKYSEAFFTMCTGLFMGVFLNQYKTEREVSHMRKNIEDITNSRKNEIKKNELLKAIWERIQSSAYVFFFYMDSEIPFYENAGQSVFLKEYLHYTYSQRFVFYERDLEKLIPLMDVASKALRKNTQYVLTVPVRDFIQHADAEFPIYEFLAKFLIRCFGIFFVWEGTPRQVVYYLNKDKCRESMSDRYCTPKMFSDACAFLVTMGCVEVVNPMVHLVESELTQEFSEEKQNLEYVIDHADEIYSNKNAGAAPNQNRQFLERLLETQEHMQEDEYIPSYEISNYIRHESKRYEASEDASDDEKDVKSVKGGNGQGWNTSGLWRTFGMLA